jgi:aspartyl-tRNA(Asn)/glutamyl-tRNA(Gln) amidotransferase subunit A
VFLFESINTYHSQLRNGSTTCLAAVEHYLARIAGNKHLNAFVRTYDVEACNAAKRLDENRAAGKPLGKLHGVVIAIKDVICYKIIP